jgi:cytochrome c biogenesis protein CcmG/thiol:disulfide interchange protein DsbE
MARFRRCALPLALLAAAGAAPTIAPAQPADPRPAPAAPAAAPLAPEAQRVLDRLKDAAARTQQVSVKVTMTSTVSLDGEEQKQEQSLTVAAARPNKVAVRSADDDEAGQYAVVSDGTTMTIFIGGTFNKYASGKAPAGFAGFIDEASFGQRVEPESFIMGPHLLLPALLDGQAFDRFVGRATGVTYVGREDIAGTPCDHIRFALPRFDADLWATAEGDARPVRLAPDMSRMLDGLGAMAEEMRARMPRTEIAFTGWATPEALPDTAFQFKAPEGAQKVDDLMKAMQEQAGNDDSGAAHAALLGRPAPGVDLDLLDGGSMSLAAHKDKHVVVLDFWATWCGPCVRGLPVVAKVAAEFKDKGVVFYAVNQQEPAATVRRFLEKRDLALAVPMDKSGRAARAFHVTGIPQTVLIGKDGTVQVIHVGFDPAMEEQLRGELRTLVDGRTIAPPPKDAPASTPAKEP